MSTAFTDTERAILRIVQFQLPDTLTRMRTSPAKWGLMRKRC